MLPQTQTLIYYLGSIILLIALIVALICIIVLRDRRELKTKELATGLSQLEEAARGLEKIRGELTPALAALKKNENALVQVEGQLKQIAAAVANQEHRPQPAGALKEKQDEHRERDRGPRQSGRGKGWGGNRNDGRQREYVAPAGESGEAVAINDGEKYAKVSELAAHGMSAQEIAKKLNVGQDEVTLVLGLKGKKP